MNEQLTYQVIEAAIKAGVREFILCAGSRNSSFVQALKNQPKLNVYYWPEERSGAFFAIGRSRALQQPVAVVTTSGPAVAELLSAAMEAYYSGDPLVLITADRPKRFRGSGAPQSAEHVGIFSVYAVHSQDLELSDACDLSSWKQNGPVHLNVCLEEPRKEEPVPHHQLDNLPFVRKTKECDQTQLNQLNQFLQTVRRPLAVVSSLKAEVRLSVVEFLQRLNIPIYIEGISGLREHPDLQALRLKGTEKILQRAQESGYEIDGILRIGGVPTNRLWRDLEYLEGSIQVCSLNDVPFSGLSWNRNMICAPVDAILDACDGKYTFESTGDLFQRDVEFHQFLQELFLEEPQSEPALVHALSKEIQTGSFVYLGNSMPIRYWDMAAPSEDRRLDVRASRGVNGIDGQISTFFGLCSRSRPNWAIVGDLTALYDLAAPWILSQLEVGPLHLVILNNEGGRIFERLYRDKEMLNLHSLRFEHFAKLWELSYHSWQHIPSNIELASPSVIEILPDNLATTRFWEKLTKWQSACAHK